MSCSLSLLPFVANVILFVSIKKAHVLNIRSFFQQPHDLKEQITQKKSQFFNGYRGLRTSFTNLGESIDVKESMSWRYDPKYDPATKDLSAIPAEVLPWIRGEEFVWEGTSHLPGFKEEVLTYWGACLTLARKLVRVFALALDLDEDYFESRTTYPGADGVFNYYPVMEEGERNGGSVGLGSHTDLQLFTLLWQDMIGGLQVLNRDGQWIKASSAATLGIGTRSLSDNRHLPSRIRLSSISVTS